MSSIKSAIIKNAIWSNCNHKIKLVFDPRLEPVLEALRTETVDNFKELKDTHQWTNDEIQYVCEALLVREDWQEMTAYVLDHVCDPNTTTIGRLIGLGVDRVGAHAINLPLAQHIADWMVAHGQGARALEDLQNNCYLNASRIEEACQIIKAAEDRLVLANETHERGLAGLGRKM